MPFPNGKSRRAGLWGMGIAVGLLLSVVMLACHETPEPLEDTYRNIAKKREVVSQMRIDLLKSVEMEKNAVMALTDKESQEYADQSLAATGAVDQNLKQLDSLITAAPLQDEQKLIAEFGTCWTDLRQLDQVILELAVQNTNLKAASLSREKGSEVMRRFEQALEDVIRSYSGTPNEGRVTRLSYRALTAGLKIHDLHSSHIPEASDEKMDQLEVQMKTEETEVSKSLAELAGIVGGEGRKALLQAKAAFSEFMEVNAKVLELSRQNSNVKSLELSLGNKRRVAAECGEILETLQETVQNRISRATR